MLVLANVKTVIMRETNVIKQPPKYEFILLNIHEQKTFN